MQKMEAETLGDKQSDVKVKALVNLLLDTKAAIAVELFWRDSG